MTRQEMMNHATTLGNIGIALSQVEVKGEDNLNYLLASIQQIRKVKNALKECAEHEAENEHRE